MAININELLQTIRDGISELAKESFSGFMEEAGSDAEIIFNELKGDVESWARQMESGELSMDDLTFLMKGKKDLMKIAALTQIGAAKIQMDKFKQGVVDIVVSSVTSVVK